MDVKNTSIRAYFKREQFISKHLNSLQNDAVYNTKKKLRELYGNKISLKVYTIYGIHYVVVEDLEEYYFGWRDNGLVMKHKTQRYNDYYRVDSIADIGQVIADWEGL